MTRYDGAPMGNRDPIAKERPVYTDSSHCSNYTGPRKCKDYVCSSEHFPSVFSPKRSSIKRVVPGTLHRLGSRCRRRTKS